MNKLYLHEQVVSTTNNLAALGRQFINLSEKNTLSRSSVSEGQGQVHRVVTIADL